MDEALKYILEGLSAIAVVVITRFLIPWIRTLIANTQYEWVLKIVDAAVRAAEQTITDPKTGKIKKEKVIELVNKVLAEKHIKMDADLIDSIIESAVFTMNNEIEEKRKTEKVSE